MSFQRKLELQFSKLVGRAIRSISSGLVVALAAVFFPCAAQGQQYRVLHVFTGPDGAVPSGVLTVDPAGKLYGTTQEGGIIGYNCVTGCGTVFELTRSGQGWELTSLHKFSGGANGEYPLAGVVFGPDGDLYGTTPYGDPTPPTFSDKGTVYKLVRGSCAQGCPWVHTVLHRFLTFHDGDNPSGGNLVFDRAGNLYGTLQYGGPSCLGGLDDPCGAVYELSPSGGSWVESLVYSFTGGTDGNWPTGGVVFDRQGDLYGVTEYGGIYQYGNAYELSPSHSGWIETAIYSFGRLGYPAPGVAIDGQGHLYGIAGNTVFELIRLGDGWVLDPLYGFFGDYLFFNGPLVMDGTGSLFGTTVDGGSGGGNVFKLSPSPIGWIYTDLHDFEPRDALGGWGPASGVTLDADGNIFGTTAFGGDFGCNPPTGCGVVWEIAAN